MHRPHIVEGHFVDPRHIERQRFLARTLLTYPVDPSGALAASAELTRVIAPALDVVLDRLPELRIAGPAAPSGGILRSVKSLPVVWRPA